MPPEPSSPPEPAALRAWQRAVASRDVTLLDDLLADDVVFRSPAVFTPQQGRAATARYLAAAVDVLGPTLSYTHRWYDDLSAVLEFEADLDGTVVHGVDMLRWNAAGRLTTVTVMVRPIRGLQRLIEQMGRRLSTQHTSANPQP